MRNKFFLFLVIIFSVHLGFRIYEYKDAYLTPFDPNYWNQRYEYSQWSTKPACENLDPHVNPFTCQWDDNWHALNEDGKNGIYYKKNTIGDDSLYTYAGWEYIHGHDPTLLNAEVPPFGKYLIGLSEVVFHNQNVFALVSGMFALVAFYIFSMQIFKDRLVAFLPVAALSFEPLFYTLLRSPYLDLLYLGLLLMTLAFFLRKQFILAAIFLGLMAATKSAASTFPLVVGVCCFYLLFTKQFNLIKKYILSLPVAGFVFTLTYIQFFLLGNSFREFLGVQKWIIAFYSSGAQGSLITPWEILFTGKWHTWWDEYVTVTEWHIGWPILVFVSAFAIFQLARIHIAKPIFVCGLWVVTYIIFLSFIPTWPRYLLVVLPFMYNLAIWTLFKNANGIKRTERVKNK